MTPPPLLDREGPVPERSPTSGRATRRPEHDDAFVVFVHAQTPALLRLSTAMTGSRHDAWDLTQETLVRIGERWSRLDDPAAYARTVMSRLNIDRIRRLRREAPSWLGGQEPAAGLPAPTGGDGAGWWLPEALAELGPRQRTALALRYVEDLDLVAIADRMGCSTGTVKSHLSRGTDRLRTFARENGHLPDTNRTDPTGSDR